MSVLNQGPFKCIARELTEIFLGTIVEELFFFLFFLSPRIALRTNPTNLWTFAVRHFVYFPHFWTIIWNRNIQSPNLRTSIICNKLYNLPLITPYMCRCLKTYALITIAQSRESLSLQCWRLGDMSTCCKDKSVLSYLQPSWYQLIHFLPYK